MKHKLRKDPEDVLKMIVEGVKLRHLYEQRGILARGFSRTEGDFACRVVEAAIKAGATTINLPDTVGYAVPGRIRRPHRPCDPQYAQQRQGHFSACTATTTLGLPWPTISAAFRVGVRQAEVTLCGIGERAGNAALEEVVMNLVCATTTSSLSTTS